MASDGLCTKNDHGTKRKSAVQLQLLEEFFSENNYPKQTEVVDYAVSLRLTYNQIRTWFIERRRKERKLTGHSSQNISLSSKRNNDICQFVARNNAGSRFVEVADSGSAHSQEVAEVFSDDDDLIEKVRRSTEMKAHSTSRCCKTCDTEKTKFQKNYSARNRVSSRSCSVRHKDNCKVLVERNYSFLRKQDRAQSKHIIQMQALFSKDYILKRIFRKDGPTLGIEFDSLPKNAFIYQDVSRNHLRSSKSNQRSSKRRKILKSPVMESLQKEVPPKKYGIGKGLMTAWHATFTTCGKLPKNGKVPWTMSKSSSLPMETKLHISKKSKPKKAAPKRKTSIKKPQEMRKPPLKRKVSFNTERSSRRLWVGECRLATDNSSPSEDNELISLVDDEEVELRELQEGPNPLRCSAHLASTGRHDCPFCKDLLARFPPQAVKMRQPFCTRPWDSSTELVKKLFKVVSFLYTHAAILEVCPFSLDEFAQSFHDKDSLLLGKVHVALLKVFLLDVQREIYSGFIPRASKDCRFLNFLHFVRQQEFDLDIWSQCLNPLTWAEILRQVLVAAGYGSKRNDLKKSFIDKERSQMKKYGLRPRTLKGELFSILSGKGSAGMKVSELAGKASQVAELDLPSVSRELDDLICFTLSSDITLFEKIGSLAYRLRVDPHIKGFETSHTDDEDSGSVDDEADNLSTSAGHEKSDDDELNSATCKKRLVKYKTDQEKTGELIRYTEIDESYSGESWALGLMEGEYSDLSIEEKLEVLINLIDLAGAGSSFRMEEPVRTLPQSAPDNRFSRSGGKIKKLVARQSEHYRTFQETSARVMLNSSIDARPTDSSAFTEKASNLQLLVGKCGPNGESDAGRVHEGLSDAHPLQSIFLGFDRRYNGYWLLLGPCNSEDPGHRRIYFESSEDGHWEVIDTSQALRTLMSVLDCRGQREAYLFASLEKREAFLCRTMDDYLTTDMGHARAEGSDAFERDTNSGDGSSLVSDIDNNSFISESAICNSPTSGAIALEQGKNLEEKKQRWDRLQAFDKWIWSSFYSSLGSVKYSRRSYMESLARCENCHDLYWRDEKHCKMCHVTFELDFDLEERYAVHIATCRDGEDGSVFPKHRVLPSQLQALKAAIYAIEMGMPETALVGTWKKSTHKLWVKRLRRTSSLPELLQVLTDFVNAINQDWLYESASSVDPGMVVDDALVYFQTMPQTLSAVALWMLKLDALVVPYAEKCQSGSVQRNEPQVKRRQSQDLIDQNRELEMP